MSTTLPSSAGEPAGATYLLLFVVLLVLFVAAGALLNSISAVAELIAALFRSIFASVRALAIVGLLIACIAVVALARLDAASGAVGTVLLAS